MLLEGFERAVRAEFPRYDLCFSARVFRLRWQRLAREPRVCWLQASTSHSILYFGDSVTGTSVTLSTGSLLSSAALRTAASLGASYTQKVFVSSAFA
jgi:hypothetical protein